VCKFIDPDAYIQLELKGTTVKDWDVPINIMKDAIRNREWEKRLPSIKKAKIKILTQIGMFPRLWNVIYGKKKFY
jgi:hypothetical protein